MTREKIIIGADHAGYHLKEAIKKYLVEKGWHVEDVGTHNDDSVDYPDFAHVVAQKIASGEYEKGILICGSGIGMSITANRYRGVRAALCHSKEFAALSRQHNDANVLCLPARFIALEEAKEIVDTFLTTAFEGGRHLRRIKKIEKDNFPSS